MNPDGSIKSGMDAEYQKYAKDAEELQKARGFLK